VGAGDSAGNKSESLISKNSCSSWERGTAEDEMVR